ncbi:MAG: flagellar biosynthetic protein FliR [Methylocapsa sp.]|nr:flagellar biosynthetic protein FliR [Methylocapsa sp.]
MFFCRTGACLSLMPGFSSNRIPVRIRLFLSLSITLALAPLLLPEGERAVREASASALLPLFASEMVIGLLIGFLARIFFGALETLSGAIAMSIGLTSPLAGPLDEHEPLPAVTNLYMFSATALIFFTGLHLEVIRGLAASYAAFPISSMIDPRFGLVQISDCLANAFSVSLRISSPFVVYSFLVNLAIGLASKLVPQIPLYFITAPAVLAGGLIFLYLTCKPFLQMFYAAFSAWLVAG